MRAFSYALCIGVIAAFAYGARAAESPAASPAPPSGPGTGHIEVTADKSLEWYQDQRLYVARGNAKAVRNTMTVEADLLTAHERDMPAKPGAPGSAKTDTTSPPPAAAPPIAKAGTKPAADNGAGDIDKMTADGNVRVTTPTSHITGDHGVYDLDKHVAYMTGNNLKYETAEEIVTAKNSLEYWEDKKLAVARGDAVGIRGDRHVEGDVLTAQFRDMPNGKSQLHILTALGHVVVITASDVSRGDKAVYDVNRNIAILTGNVRITRGDGTQLAGDVGEVDFATNESRMLNEGSGRVRALIASKAAPKTGVGKQQAAATAPTGLAVITKASATAP